MIVASILCANLFVIALSTHSLQQTRRQSELRAQILTQNIVQAVDQSLSNSIEKIDLALRAITDEFERQLANGKIDPRPTTLFLEKFEQHLPEVEAIRVANADGFVVFGKGVDPDARVSWADRDYFGHLRDHPEAGMQFSKPRVGRVAKTYIVNFSRRYNYPDGRFAGVVSAPISLDYFTAFLNRFDLGSAGSIALRDADFGLIGRNPALPVEQGGGVGNQLVTRELRELAESGLTRATFYARVAIDLKERIVSYRRLAAAPMLVIASTASEDYLADWYAEAYKTAAWIAAFALLSLLAGLFVLYLMRQISRESLRNKLYLRYASDGIHILDERGNVVQASEQFCAMLGYERSEVIGMNLTQWETRWPSEELVGRIFPRLLRQPEASTFEARHRKKNGEIIDAEINVVGIELDGARFLYASSRDISERKRQQQALQDSEARLRESDERYRLLIKNSPVGILHYGPDLVVSFANDRFEEIMQVPHGYASGMDCTKLHDQSVIPPMRQAIAGETARYEGPYLTSFGCLGLWISMACAPLSSEHGEILGGIAIIEDITERKRIEAAERRQRESLASLNQISAFSHLPIADQLQQALSIGATHLGLEFGIVSHIVDDTYNIVAHTSPPDTLRNGQTFAFDETYCQITIEQNGVVAITEMGRSPYLGHPCYQSFKLEAYIGAPVHVGGKVFGTVNFSSPKPYQRGFDEGDKEFVSLLARWVGSALERDQAQTKLAASERRLRAIIENEPECVKVLGPLGELLQMNRVGLAFLEADSVDEVNTVGLINLVAAEHRQAFTELGQRVFQGETGTLEFEIVGKRGTRRWLQTHAAPLRDANDKVISLLAVTRDTTDRKQAESRLRLAASVFKHAHEGIVICDERQIILEVNPTFSEITGYARDEVIGQQTGFLASGEHSPEFCQSMWETIENRGFWEGEVWNQRKDGSTYAELLSISQVRDNEGKITHYIGTFSDISVAKAQQAQLEHLAHYDALTGLPNRVLLSDRLAQALPQAKRTEALVALGYLDLDGFKAINDEFGHAAGDTLLIEVARRLKETLRAADTVARLGGDEFVLLLVGIGSVKECELAATRILAALTEPINVQGHERRISGSLGITIFPTDDSDPDALLRHADQAMYLAKQRGKNRYVLSNHAKPAQQRAAGEQPEQMDLATPEN